MSSSQQWAGLSKPQTARKSSGRHRGQKLPGTPFFQVDPVVSLDRLDHPKPKAARRRSRKSSSTKENQPTNATTKSSSLSVGAEFSTSEGEKLSTDLRTEMTATTTFGESSVTFASDDQTTQQFLANACLAGPEGPRQLVDDTVIGQTITYASDDDAVEAAAAAAAGAGADDDNFRTGLSLSYSSTMNCKKIDVVRREATMAASSSYLKFDSSLCQFQGAPSPAPFVDIPIPEKHPAAPSPVANKDLMQPLLTSTDSDRESDRGGPPGPSPPTGIWSCLACCFPQWPMSRTSRFLI